MGLRVQCRCGKPLMSCRCMEQHDVKVLDACVHDRKLVKEALDKGYYRVIPPNNKEFSPFPGSNISPDDLTLPLEWSQPRGKYPSEPGPYITDEISGEEGAR